MHARLLAIPKQEFDLLSPIFPDEYSFIIPFTEKAITITTNVY